MNGQNWFLHADLDAFFASVEQLDHPEYRGKPVIVGGLPQDRRSVVSTASYEARKFGVHSAMPTFLAYKLCPSGIYVRGRMKRYAELSYQIMNIFREFSPDVEQMSIDEAFIDLTGTEMLFGPPQETAHKIKALVKEKTGLTVSIGLASTKYLAKIASGLSKPDGFYFIKPGNEQDFMLSLPLEKVWGLGTKSQEELKNKGFSSTKQIFLQSYDSLEFLFGKNKAAFLYNVVRGKENQAFNRETKNHSISAETTFSFDLTDSYTAETALLELAHGVFFRLLKENAFSRTVTLKIRYEDFTTVSIQKTQTQSILTLDTFFETAKKLFEEKYEKGRGIRLLGIGFDNVEKEEKPYQQELFSKNDEKKKAVEQAILKLSKKHPEIKIHKARILKNENLKSIAGAIFVLAATVFCAQNVYAQNINETKNEGASSILHDEFLQEKRNKSSTQIFKWEGSENSVEFLLSGWWKFDLTATLSSTFGNGNPFVSTFNPPVFKQAVDMSAWIFLNKHWYFEADFADEFTKNTVAAGYVGNGVVRSARISNRRIKPQLKYSADFFGYGLGGGENQAPGISVHLADPWENRWAGDAVLRYDMTSSKSKVYYGMNSVSEKKINPSDFAYGYSYDFPENTEDALLQVKNIYVENAGGNYMDKNGRRYIKLSDSEFMVFARSRRIILRSSANAQKRNGKVPAVLVKLTSGSTADSVNSKAENWIDEIADEFGINRNDMKKYLAPLTAVFSGTNEKAIVLQSPSGFTPFVSANLYDCGISNGADLLVLYADTEKEAHEFTSEVFDEPYKDIYKDFFKDAHSYAQLTSEDCKTSRYPFAKSNPEIYLNIADAQYYELSLRTYTSVKEFQIGTDAIEGSVQVFKNGTVDSGARFIKENGIVQLSSSVLPTDKIIILWQQDNGGITDGEVAAEIAFLIHFSEKVTSDFALTTRIPVSPEKKYSTQDKLTNAFAALSTGTTYTAENFTFTDKTAFSIHTENASGKLLVNSFDSKISKTFYLQETAGFKTLEDVPVLKNQSTDTEYENLQGENCVSYGGFSGEKDSGISGYKIPLKWNFSKSTTGKYWAATDIQLNQGQLLKNSSELRLALKSDIPSDSSKYNVYLQLGVKASDKWLGEDKEKIPTFKLNGTGAGEFNTSLSTWQKITIPLTDYDRARLCSNYDARLIVVSDGSLKEGSGTIYFGPYEPVVKAVFAQAAHSSYTISESTTADFSSPSARELSKKENYSAAVKWKWTSNEPISSTNQEERTITITSNFAPADFTNYKNINISFKITSDDNTDLDSNDFITLSLDSNASSLRKSDTALALKLPLNNIQKNRWNTICINTFDKSVTLNGTPEGQKAELNKKNIPVRQKIELNTKLENGTIYIDNLYYSDISPLLTAQNYFSTRYNFKKGYIQADSLQSGTFSTEPANTSAQNGSLDGHTAGGITLGGIKIEADIAAHTATGDSDKNILKDAGHSVSTENAILNVIDFSEDYRFDHTGKAVKKSDSLSLNFSKLKFPLQLQFNTEAQSEYLQQSQNTSLAASYSYNNEKFAIGGASKVNASQKISSAKTEPVNSDNYFYGWKDISAIEFSTGKENALRRNLKYENTLWTKLPFAQFSPSVSYDINGKYETKPFTSFSDSQTVTMKFPFILNRNSFNFSMAKSAGGIQKINSSASYFEDSSYTGSGIQEHSWIFKTAPFYDLFDSNIKNYAENSVYGNKESAAYSTKYDFSWKRSLFDSISDLFVPSSSSLSVSRNIKSDLKTSDLYQFKSVITNTSLNNFGTNGKLPVFAWYENDEVISSITTVFKVPSDEPSRTTFLISYYLQVLFYLSPENTIQTAFDISFENDGIWNLDTTLIWSRSAKNALIHDIVLYFAKDREINAKIQRKDILNFNLSQGSNEMLQKYSYQHSVEINILKHYFITTGTGCALTWRQKNASLLEIFLSIGGKMEF